jgi:hypothetical protein
MRFEVSNMGGCRAADIQVSRGAILAGTSGQGKSSIVLCVRAAVTGNTVPTGEVKKGEALRLVKSGAEKGSVRWEGEGYAVSVAYPKAEMKLEKGSGSPPAVSAFAAGLECITEVDAKKRPAILGPLLKIEPTRDDVLAALREANLHKPSDAALDIDAVADMRTIGLNDDDDNDRGLYRLLKSLWKTITDKGWNTAHKDAAAKGVDLKAEWKAITRHSGNYGPALAESWKPAIWDDELAATSLSDLEGAVHRADAAKIAAAKAEGASEAIIAELKAKVDALPDLERTLVTAKRRMDKAREADQPFKIKTPPAIPSSGTPCPHCAGSVSIVSDLAGPRLEKAQHIDEATIEAAKAARAAFERDRAAADKEFRDAYDALQVAERDAMSVRAAQTRLNELQAVAASTMSVADAEAAMTVARDRLAAFKAFHEARAKHESIVVNAGIVELLDENKGVRRTKLVEGIEAFNRDVLAPLCRAAKVRPVTLNDELGIEYGGRSILLSEGERAKVRIIMQTAIAKVDGSALVVVDNFDRLPAEERGNFIQMLHGTGLHWIVSLMVPTPDKVPDIGPAGMGATYWLDDGVAYTRADAMKQMGAKAA